MSSSKKRRDLNRASTEHDIKRFRAENAISNHAMLDITKSALGQYAKKLEEDIRLARAACGEYISESMELDCAIKNIVDAYKERNQTASLFCGDLNECERKLAEVSAALAAKDEALSELMEQMKGRASCVSYREVIDGALSLQPHVSVLNKIRADAVREGLAEWEDTTKPIYKFMHEYADRIEKGEAR